MLKRILVLLALALQSTPALFAATSSDANLAGRSKSVALAGDDQAVTCTGVGLVLLSSDNGTATNRTFTLTASALVGHRCTLVWDESSTDKAEFLDTSIQKLAGDWKPRTRYESITLVSDGTNWLEDSRSSGLVPGNVLTSTLTADNSAVDPNGYSVVLLDSDDTTATNRTFTLTASPVVGHRLTLIHAGTTNLCEIADTGIQKLSAAWTCAAADSLTLISDGTNWIEVGRADN